jgi:hypothetical protein
MSDRLTTGSSYGIAKKEKTSLPTAEVGPRARTVPQSRGIQKVYNTGETGTDVPIVFTLHSLQISTASYDIPNDALAVQGNNHDTSNMLHCYHGTSGREERDFWPDII